MTRTPKSGSQKSQKGPPAVNPWTCRSQDASHLSRHGRPRHRVRGHQTSGPPLQGRAAQSPRRPAPAGGRAVQAAHTCWGPGGGSPPCQALPEAPREGGSNSIQQMTGPRPGVQRWAQGRVAVPRAHGDRAPTPRRALLGTKWAKGPQEQGCGQGGQGAEGSHATHIPSVTLTPSWAEAPEPNDANRGLGRALAPPDAWRPGADRPHPHPGLRAAAALSPRDPAGLPHGDPLLRLSVMISS